MNEKIQENPHYETEEAPCLNREQLRLQLGDYSSKIKIYSPQIDKLESYDSQKLKDLHTNDIEKLIDEAKTLTRSLDLSNQDLDEISTYLKEERKDFKDGDTYSNHSRIDREIDSLSSRLAAAHTQFKPIKEMVGNNEISNPKISSKYKKVESIITNCTRMLEK